METIKGSSEDRRSSSSGITLWSPMTVVVLHPALRRLCEAFAFCQDVCPEDPMRHATDFASDFRALRRAGLTKGEVHWLLQKGWLVQIAPANAPAVTNGRSMEQSCRSARRDRTLFTLTPLGVTAIDRIAAVLADLGLTGETLLPAIVVRPCCSSTTRPRSSPVRRETATSRLPSSFHRLHRGWCRIGMGNSENCE